MSIKEFFSRFMSDDETNHEFTTSEKIMYGILVPLGFVAVMCLAGCIEASCQ